MDTVIARIVPHWTVCSFHQLFTLPLLSLCSHLKWRNWFCFSPLAAAVHIYCSLIGAHTLLLAVCFSCLKVPAICCLCWSTASLGFSKSCYTFHQSSIWAVGNIMRWKKTWKSCNECCGPNLWNKQKIKCGYATHISETELFFRLSVWTHNNVDSFL